MSYSLDRSDTRTQALIAVMLASLDGRLFTESTFTENVSSRGARVLTKQRWRANDPLVIKSLEGGFQSEARVVYNQTLNEDSSAIGLVLLHPSGQWSGKGS